MNQSDLNAALEKLSALNIKLTPQRYAVLECLYSMETNDTVQDIYQVLVHKYPHISVTTINNHLKVFKKMGLVTDLAAG